MEKIMKEITLSELFDSLPDGLPTNSSLEYKGWTIKPSPSGYGYTVRTPEGYLSLETNKDGTIKECESYIDNAMSFKAGTK